MRIPSVRTRRFVSLSAAPLAVLLAGAMVWQGSNAAFTADTRNNGNSWQTGTLSLTDDAGSAMFVVKNVKPGDTGVKCIQVTSTSSVPGIVKLYVGGLATDGLQDYVKVTIDRGPTGTFAACDPLFAPAATLAQSSLTALFSANASYATGVLPWVTTGVTAGESMSYRFTWVFDVGGMDQAGIDALQGKASSINFEWELQNS